MNSIEGYLLDTNIASASWDYGAPSHGCVRQRLEELGNALVYVAAVSIAEVEYGLQIAPSIDAQRQSTVRSAMASYRVLHVDQHTAQAYAEIRANLFRTHAPRNRRGRLTKKHVEELVDRTTGRELGIQENDLWIVSIAVQYNLKLVTNDRMPRVIEAASYSDRTESWNEST